MAAAFLIDEGADAFTLTELLGHEDVRTTFRHYGHRLPNKQAEIMAGLDRRRTEAAARVAQMWPNVTELSNAAEA